MPAEPSARTQDVLAALVDLVLAEGFASLGVADLARRLQCSKTTLYALAPSKEQLIERAVREFFRAATARVEAAVDPDAEPVVQLEQYLGAIAVQLGPASPAFYANVSAFEPARRVYRQNTAAAADRVQGLVGRAARGADASFVGEVAALVMEAIHSQRIEATTGLDDAAAYRSLARLVVAAVRAG
ncbi:MAG: TetR/AcrR family transcriptional regulator [Aeromicrobium erythreum]